MGGDNVPPLVEIGLNDPPKSGGSMAPPAPPGTTGLRIIYYLIAYSHSRMKQKSMITSASLFCPYDEIEITL